MGIHVLNLLSYITNTRLILVGLAIRLVLIMFISSSLIDDFYLPFMLNSVNEFNIFPWSTWLENGGSKEAFPYGYIMWLVFLPSAILSLFGISIEFGYFVTLLLADFGILIGLHHISSAKTKLISLTYWLSPIIILATYVIGVNDIVPVVFLVYSFFSLKLYRFKIAGGLLAMAISAKLSMILAMPFMFLYLYNNNKLRQFTFNFLTTLTLVSIILIIPHLISTSGREMLFGNSEMIKITELKFSVGQMLQIYVIPLIYIIFIYAFWRLRRTNFDLLISSIAITFLIVVLLTNASVGWFIWTMPFLAIYAAQSGRLTTIIIGVFSILYIILLFARTPILIENVLNLFVIFNTHPIYVMDVNHLSILQTLIISIGLILILRLWRQAYQENNFYQLTRKKFLIGIAGDSGSGKDTLVEDLSGLFGYHSCAKISGDDYHVWDRRATIWRGLSHLNPAANDLTQMSNDIVSLSNNRHVYIKHYDHKIGRYNAPNEVSSNDIIFVSGLHALYPELSLSLYDLKIFLDIDEELRRFLKINRDITNRGQTVGQVLENINRRSPDAERFIASQKQYADLIISLEPTNREQLNDYIKKDRLDLRVKFVSSKIDNQQTLYRVFVGILGLSVSITSKSNGSITMIIYGNSSQQDIEMAAKKMFTKELDLLDIMPDWKSNERGIIQLVVLSYISCILMRRIAR